MINDYLCDIINIVKYTFDEWGRQTARTVTSNVNARIEDTNKLIRNGEGKEVVGNSIIFVDDAVDIKYGDRIQLTSRIGESIENPGKEYGIQKLSKIHGFCLSHWEIYI